jgi:hypothetical protein
MIVTLRITSPILCLGTLGFGRGATSGGGYMRGGGQGRGRASGGSVGSGAGHVDVVELTTLCCGRGAAGKEFFR